MSDEVWLVIVAVIPFYIAVFLAIFEVIGRPDLTASRKAVWIALLVFVAPIALAVYVIARPPRHRAAVAEIAPGTHRAEQLVGLVEQHSFGDIDDDSYCAAVAKLRTGDQIVPNS